MPYEKRTQVCFIPVVHYIWCILFVFSSVNCPLGTHYSLERSVCESCLMGSYQDEEGQLECKLCPAGTHTEYLHSRSISECKGRGFMHVLNRSLNFLLQLGNQNGKYDEIRALLETIALFFFFQL